MQFAAAELHIQTWKTYRMHALVLFQSLKNLLFPFTFNVHKKQTELLKKCRPFLSIKNCSITVGATKNIENTCFCTFPLFKNLCNSLYIEHQKQNQFNFSKSAGQFMHQKHSIWSGGREVGGRTAGRHTKIAIKYAICKDMSAKCMPTPLQKHE